VKKDRLSLIILKIKIILPNKVFDQESFHSLQVENVMTGVSTGEAGRGGGMVS
jgi:hypothetical protein